MISLGYISQFWHLKEVLLHDPSILADRLILDNDLYSIQLLSDPRKHLVLVISVFLCFSSVTVWVVNFPERTRIGCGLHSCSSCLLLLCCYVTSDMSDIQSVLIGHIKKTNVPRPLPPLCSQTNSTTNNIVNRACADRRNNEINNNVIYFSDFHQKCKTQGNSLWQH